MDRWGERGERTEKDSNNVSTPPAVAVDTWHRDENQHPLHMLLIDYT